MRAIFAADMTHHWKILRLIVRLNVVSAVKRASGLYSDL